MKRFIKEIVIPICMVILGVYVALFILARQEFIIPDEPSQIECEITPVIDVIEPNDYSEEYQGILLIIKKKKKLPPFSLVNYYYDIESGRYRLRSNFKRR